MLDKINRWDMEISWCEDGINRVVEPWLRKNGEWVHIEDVEHYLNILEDIKTIVNYETEEEGNTSSCILEIKNLLNTL